MNGKDLEKFNKKIVFMRMKDGFVKFAFVDKVEGEEIITVNHQNKISINNSDEVLSIRELDYKERMKFLEKRAECGF